MHIQHIKSVMHRILHKSCIHQSLLYSPFRPCKASNISQPIGTVLPPRTPLLGLILFGLAALTVRMAFVKVSGVLVGKHDSLVWSFLPRADSPNYSVDARQIV